MLLRLSLIISSLLCNKLQQVQVPATCSTMKTDQMPPDARVLFCKFNSQEKILYFNLIIFGEPLLLLSTKYYSVLSSLWRRRQIFRVGIKCTDGYLVDILSSSITYSKFPADVVCPLLPALFGCLGY